MNERIFFCRKPGCRNRARGDRGRFGRCDLDGESFISAGEKIVLEEKAAENDYRETLASVNGDYGCLQCDFYSEKEGSCPAGHPLKSKDEILRDLEEYHQTRLFEIECLVGLSFAPKEGNGQIKVVWEKDLKSIEASPNRWIVNGYISENSIVLLAGKRGFYKSWGGLQLAVAIASGKSFLGKYQTVQSKVLYLDEENGVETLKERVAMIKKGMGLEGDIDNLCFSSFAGFKIGHNDARQELEQFIQENDIRVVIADTFRRIISSEENDATEMNGVFTSLLRPISSRHGVTWILLHHLRKGVAGRQPSDLLDELRGSSELANYADAVIIFEKPPKTEGRFNLIHAKSRKSQAQEAKMVELKWDEDSVRFQVLGTAQAILDAVDECAIKIMQFLEENAIGQYRTGEFYKSMKPYEYSKSTVDRALSHLFEQGKLRKIKKGLYSRITGKLEDYDESEEQDES